MTTGDTQPGPPDVTLISVSSPAPAQLCPSKPSDACSPAWRLLPSQSSSARALPPAELKPAFWKLPPCAHMTAARGLVRPLLTLRGHEKSTTLYPLWLFLGAAPGTCGMVVPLLQVRKRWSVVPCESESRPHSAHLHDRCTFPSRGGGLG